MPSNPVFTATPAAGRLLVTFLLREEEFGIDIMRVEEIIRPPRVTAVPGCAEYVDGIANLRGAIVPVIDLRARLAMERCAETDASRVLVVNAGGYSLGFRVDAVLQIRHALSEDIEPSPRVLQGIPAGYIEGILNVPSTGRMVMVLKAAPLCAACAPSDALSPQAPAKGPREPQGGTMQTLVTFRCGDEEYGFRMQNVREVLRMGSLSPVPDAPGFILGILTLRGRIVPVIDTRRLLGKQPLGEELRLGCRVLREEFERAAETNAAGPAERLRDWLRATGTANPRLMEFLMKVKRLNEGASDARRIAAALHLLEQETDSKVVEDQRIIAVELDGSCLGFAVDHVNEVLEAPGELLEPPPGLLSGSAVELEAIAKLNGGARIILIPDIDKLASEWRLRDMLPAEKETGVPEAGADAGDVQVVAVVAGAAEYGFPISQVGRIERLARITKVPTAARFVDGIANLRGEVLPILDLRARLDLARRMPDHRTRIVVVDLAGCRTGVVVDAVSGVLRLAKDTVNSPPEAVRQTEGPQLICGIGRVGSSGRVIALLDVQAICSA